MGPTNAQITPLLVDSQQLKERDSILCKLLIEFAGTFICHTRLSMQWIQYMTPIKNITVPQVPHYHKAYNCSCPLTSLTP